MSCVTCHTRRPALVRPKTGERVCRECFFAAFEDEVHATITSDGLMKCVRVGVFVCLCVCVCVCWRACVFVFIIL
jgi:hypothetical protein